MRPQKRVLISINEPNITKVITLTLEKEFSNTYDLCISETPYVAKLLAQAQHEAVDLFILLLNNMRLSDVPFLHEKKPWGEAMWEVVRHLRQTYHKPVIAMTGLPPIDTWEEEIMKQSGLSFFFLLPVEGAALTNAVHQCLEEGALA
jgi:CheY-like chemotaxis protein